MSAFINSFAIDVPDIQAEQYHVDPQPPEDAWHQLDDIENATERELSGNAYRYREGGTWYILVIEGNSTPATFTIGTGTQLTWEETRRLDHDNHRHQEIIERALRDNLAWYLTQQLDYWERARSKEFYERESRDTINSYDAYPGFDTQIDYSDGFYLTVDPKTKFISSRSVGQYLRDPRLTTDDVRDRLLNRYCTLMSTQRYSVELISIADEVTVSDTSMTINDEDMSVIEYMENNPDRYPPDIRNRVEPDEPIAKVLFPWSDEPSNTAPSLLHPLPDEMEGRMTGYAARSAANRWRDTREFVQQIQYIQMYGVTCEVDNQPRSDTVDEYDYPRLRFGDDAILTINQNTTSTDEPTAHPRDWNRAIQHQLEEAGAAKRLRGVPEIGVLHPAGHQQSGEEAYEQIKEYVESYTRLRLPNRAGTVNYENPEKLNEWLQRYQDDIDGVLILLGDDPADYMDLRMILDGLPAQAIRLENYRQASQSNQFDDRLFNTAIGLATKIGVRPLLLADGLSADAYLGFSVAGDDINTAAAVLLSGQDGDLVYQTRSNLAAGPSTVTPERIIQQIIQKSITKAIAESDGDINSIVIHKNGKIGDKEIEGIESGIDDLIAHDTLPTDTEWAAIQIASNSRYRIYNTAEYDHVAPTNAYARLDGRNVLVTTFGWPHLHQGTPQPLHCTVEAWNTAMNVERIGEDIAALSFLNWGAPTMKMKEPLTTHLPAKMHNILGAGARLDYPPF